LPGKDGDVCAGGDFADSFSCKLDDDAGTKKGEKIDQPATLESTFAMETRTDKGWFDLRR
jgi:hypothetical protein